jgi:hypothetical protein
MVEQQHLTGVLGLWNQRATSHRKPHQKTGGRTVLNGGGGGSEINDEIAWNGALVLGL